ncbi:MAG: hypothetical protein L0Z62_37705 [Gemmataceae bacterium]|nr:hypothetical protein [Gemmataceae bacterium]
MRVNALANPEVGKFLNENFCSAYQKVGTFRIVNKQKQGGNVAAYFCAPDGRVLHCVAGPVNAATMLREAKWVVSTTEKAIAEAKGDGAAFKAHFRKAHAAKLRTEHGLAVEPVTYDPPVDEDPNSPLTYRDPTGRPLAPKLQPAPIDGPDVKLRHLQVEAKAALGAMPVADRGGRRWVLGNQGRVHVLLAAHSMQPLEKLYASVFEGILGERISTRPVEIVDPFPWRNNPNARRIPASELDIKKLNGGINR